MDANKAMEEALESSRESADESVQELLVSISQAQDTIRDNIDEIVHINRVHLSESLWPIINELNDQNGALKRSIDAEKAARKDLEAAVEKAQDRIDALASEKSGGKEIGFIIGAVFTSIVWACVLWYIYG